MFLEEEIYIYILYNIHDNFEIKNGYAWSLLNINTVVEPANDWICNNKSKRIVSPIMTSLPNLSECGVSLKQQAARSLI
jgi:hypothetical protein